MVNNETSNGVNPMKKITNLLKRKRPYSHELVKVGEQLELLPMDYDDVPYILSLIHI